MQTAISKSLFLITVTIGLATGTNNATFAYEGNSWNVDSSNVSKPDRIKSITLLQAQLPFPRIRSDRNDVRRNRREDLESERQECLEEDDRDDRRECLQDLRSDRDYRESERQECLEEDNRDDRRECLQDLRSDRNDNRQRNRRNLGNRRHRSYDRPLNLPSRNRFPY